MITKAWFTFEDDQGEDWTKEEKYDDEIENIGQLEERAFQWLQDEGLDTGERTWNDIVFSTTSRQITFENGRLSIDHGYAGMIKQ